MGAWGPGLLEDDDAADVHSEWVRRMENGEDPAEASEAMAAKVTTSLARVALAAAQIETGYRHEAVLRRARADLDDDPVLFENWDDPADVAARRKSVAAMRRKIDAMLAEQSSKLRRPAKWVDTTLEVGQVYGYRWSPHRIVPLWVVGIDDSGDVTYPVVQVLDWVGADPGGVDVKLLAVKEDPSPERPESSSLRERFQYRDNARSFKLVNTDARQRPEQELIPLGLRPVRSLLKPTRTYVVVGWPRLAQHLEKLFGA